MGHNNDVNCCEWHPNCRLIASGSDDKIIRLWEVKSGYNNNIIIMLFLYLYRNTVRCCIGHKSSVTCLAFYQDNTPLLVSGSLDGEIIIWNLSIKTADKIWKRLNEHTKMVNSISTSYDGCYIASCSMDGTIKLWWNGNENNTSENTFYTKNSTIQNCFFNMRNIIIGCGCYNI